MEDQPGSRVNKYLSEIGQCSRREADKMVAQGRVRINGKLAEQGSRVLKSDMVELDGRRVSDELEPDVYLAFHKPEGIVSTTDTTEKDNIINYIGYPRRIFPIGRLDKPSSGLILLTSDGDIVNKILRAHNNHEKEYQVTVNHNIHSNFIGQMAGGLPILGTMTKKCEVVQTGPKTFTIKLTQGLNRQIRRMCEYLNYEVVALKRVRIMNIVLDLPPGDWRELTETELSEIQGLLAKSTKTSKASTSPKPKGKSSYRPKTTTTWTERNGNPKKKNKNPGNRSKSGSKPSSPTKGRRGKR
ncbi:MAG: 23S rRNA pseudouridine2604 synthase [Marinoscillum sp.]|jgi:23S rRNA pseudouridine2604 synthase